jgi:hypothetical protein
MKNFQWHASKVFFVGEDVRHEIRNYWCVRRVHSAKWKLAPTFTANPIQSNLGTLIKIVNSLCLYGNRKFLDKFLFNGFY